MSHMNLLEELTQDLNGSIYDFEKFLNNSNKRSLTENQKRIILANHYNKLRDAYNNVVLNKEITIEERTTLLFDIIPKLQDLLNVVNRYKVDEEIKLQIGNVLNLSHSALVGPSGDNNIWYHLASANLLIQILTGVQTFETKPNLIYPPEQGFWKNNAVKMNSLRSIALIHLGAIISLSHVNLERSKCIEWANITFRHLNYIENYYQKVNLLSYAKALKGKERDIYYGALIRHTVINMIFITGYYIQRLFGNVWPLEINTFGLIKKRTTDGIVEFCKYEQANIEIVTNSFQEYYNKGIIDPNEPPGKYPFFDNIIQLKNVYSSMSSIFQALDESMRFNLNYNSKLTLESINQGIISIKQYRNYLIKYGNGIDSFFVHFINYEIALVFTKSLYLKDMKLFNDYIRNLNELISKIKMSSYPELTYTILLTKICLICELSNNHDLTKELDSISELLNSLQRRPRLYITLTFFNAILSVITGRMGKDRFLLEIEKSKNILQTFGQVHLEIRFQIFSRYLLSVFFNSDPQRITNTNLASLDISENSLDIFSWIKPNLAKLNVHTNVIEIIWFPFNLESYTFLD